MDDVPSKPKFFERMLSRISSDIPESQEEISQYIRLAHAYRLIDTDTFFLLERVLAFSALDVRDVMVPRSSMDVIRADARWEEILSYVVKAPHSRFPVIGKDKDDVLGVLHTKDLLQGVCQADDFDIRKILREAVFIPEGKSLNSLIKYFKDKHLHLAIVLDEYGGVSGMVTFEDVIEEIIGDIEDEFDEKDGAPIVALGENAFRVNALMPLKDFNAFFKTAFEDDEVDTIGGFMMHRFGRLPMNKEKISIDGMDVTVLKADRRRLYTLKVEEKS